MAPKIHFPLLYFFSVVILYSCVIEQPIAFSIKLIHRYAPESPFYNLNVNDHEIVEKLNSETRSRKTGNGTLLDLQTFRPYLRSDLGLYLVKVSLGTSFSSSRISHEPYYLVLATGRSTTWLQCEDCKKSGNHCYRQFNRPFSNSMSSSYKPLPCGRHPLCFPNDCIKDSCSYFHIYHVGGYSNGILAHEKFAFPSSTGHEEIVPLVFGCGIDNHFLAGVYDDLLWAGFFGLGWGPRSFVTQTKSITHGRFSYCFPPKIQATQGSPIFLRFGSDIPSYSTLPSTKLIRYQGDEPYYVNLLDISVNGTRLGIPSSYFRKRGPNEGGTTFDSGYAITRITPPAYEMVKRAVERHIARYVTSLEIHEGQISHFDLCYLAYKPFGGQSSLPLITFHFKGNAHLVIRPDIAFELISYDDAYIEHICLSMMSSGAQRNTVIGTNLQANQFIVYDVIDKRMYFGPRDCSRDS